MDKDDPTTPDTPTHDEMFARAREAVLDMRGTGQNEKSGKLEPGNAVALKHGVRSTRILLNPDILAWHREQVIAISNDLGGESELSTLQISHVREVARLEVILAALGDELLNAGVLTPKGNMRVCTTAYLHVLDRFVKVASAVGIQRVSKRIESLQEIMAGNVIDQPK
jgi:hypothetical protein